MWILKLVIILACLIVFILLISRREFFQRVVAHNASWVDKLIVIILLGIFSIFCTCMGTTLPSGAIINVRDIAPMVAGLLGGPIVGLGAGLIGGIHRYFLEGLTRIPCSLATILIGLIAGFVNLWVLRQRSGDGIIKIHWAVLFAVIMELFHMGLILLIVRPFDSALNTVETIVLSMTISNAFGVGLGIFLIKRWLPNNSKSKPV